MIISKSRKTGLTLLMSGSYVLMVLMLSEHLLHGQNLWLQAAAPLILLGLPIMLYPLTEHWEYKPWQAKAQKYERHYRD